MQYWYWLLTICCVYVNWLPTEAYAQKLGETCYAVQLELHNRSQELRGFTLVPNMLFETSLWNVQPIASLYDVDDRAVILKPGEHRTLFFRGICGQPDARTTPHFYQVEAVRTFEPLPEHTAIAGHCPPKETVFKRAKRVRLGLDLVAKAQRCPCQVGMVRLRCCESDEDRKMALRAVVISAFESCDPINGFLFEGPINKYSIRNLSVKQIEEGLLIELDGEAICTTAEEIVQ